MDKHYDQREALHEVRKAEQDRKAHGFTPITVACADPDLVQEAMVQARLILKRSIITEWLEEVQRISSDVHERVAATNLLARIRRDE